ncbi:MAG: hypothetical protein JWR14_1761 [Caballeronia sp.]|nr:hypothetical protein [Caballeronia sp.]
MTSAQQRNCKKWLIASSELASTRSGGYHALTREPFAAGRRFCWQRQQLPRLLYPDARDDYCSQPTTRQRRW